MKQMKYRYMGDIVNCVYKGMKPLHLLSHSFSSFISFHAPHMTYSHYHLLTLHLIYSLILLKHTCPPLCDLYDPPYLPFLASPLPLLYLSPTFPSLPSLLPPPSFSLFSYPPSELMVLGIVGALLFIANETAMLSSSPLPLLPSPSPPPPSSSLLLLSSPPPSSSLTLLQSSWCWGSLEASCSLPMRLACSPLPFNQKRRVMQW